MFLSFILGQTSQGTVNFFFSLWHNKHLGAAFQQHLLCPKCKNIFPTAALAQWSNTKHHSILATDHTEVPWARAPAKAHQLLEKHNSPLQPQKDQQTYTFLIRPHFQITMTSWNKVYFILSSYSVKEYFLLIKMRVINTQISYLEWFCITCPGTGKFQSWSLNSNN